MKWIWILIKTILFGLLTEAIWLLFLQDLMTPTSTKNIKSFSSSKSSYHIIEPIIFNIELKNASFEEISAVLNTKDAKNIKNYYK